MSNKFIVVLGLLISAGMVNAHFTMVFPGGEMEVTPDDYIAEVGETKTILIAWGHPFEHILFDMSSVPEVTVRDPEGEVRKLMTEEVRIEGYKAYEAKFTVDKEGDWIVSVRYGDEDEQLIDLTKAVIHCGEEAWFGWDSIIGEEVEIVPYTRPYGIEEGFVFTGKALNNGRPLAGASVEVERYNLEGEVIVKATEERYSNDPPMIFTRVTTSNKEGEFAYTLDEPAIWFVGATKEIEDGYDVRGVMIVPVIEEFPPKKGASGDTTGLESKIGSLESRIRSLENKASGMSAEGGDSGIAYIAILIAVVAAILGLVAVMKK